MKKQLNEIKRMQFLAGLITESQLNETIKTVSFGPFTNVEWYKVGDKNTITLIKQEKFVTFVMYHMNIMKVHQDSLKVPF